ncbi:hypothetical protein D1823_02300 [Ruegeria sp. AD91A]|uniref:hypothetical protein n=1 Tax=Ruegeria sp. AD91A TaxID=2293862 RepID=UPI000E49EA3D|nr:hypothetical protein [Ruegeria sp. AD91A]AXT25529.1 hypothetical protein D1823_02300 [Ruegeria sp. AD91A]
MPDKPKMNLPELVHGDSQDYDTMAASYLLAAEYLWKKEKDEQFPLVAPATQLVCIGLELFLKARLLESGLTHDDLRKNYGHNIYKMWMLPQFEVMRRNAQAIALACVEVKKSEFSDPNVYTLDWTIKYLDRLYGGSTNQALRYPKGKTEVPYVQPLLWVVYELLNNPDWRSWTSSN